MELFKELNEKEEEEYKKWARENYLPLTEIKGIWHPSVQKECVLINEEEGKEDWFKKLSSVIPQLNQPPS